MKHYLNHFKILFVVFVLIVHSLPAVVVSQEFKSLDISKNRVVVNKILPPSPSNLDRTVKVPLSFAVLPDGTVGEVIPLSKGDPTLEAISIKTLKKWKFNSIEDDITMKGEITFTFSPEGGGDSHSSNERLSTQSDNKSESTKLGTYYPVNFTAWGEFMNKYAVWLDNEVNSNQGNIKELTFSFSLSEDKVYEIEIAADNIATVFFDGDEVTKVSNYVGKEIFKLFLRKGNHICSIKLFNYASATSRWEDNPVGFAMVISDNGKTIITTRDQEYVVKETAKYYPVSHPLWNDLLKNHAVWINNKENNHEGEYKDLTFETTIPKTGFYNFEISADDTAEFILDGNKIMDISYQKVIHNFKIKLEEGVHQLQMKVMNITLYKSKWEENPVGAAILIKDNSGNIVFSTRDGKYCYDIQSVLNQGANNLVKVNSSKNNDIRNIVKISRPNTYPMNIGTSLIQDHGVWVNNYGSLHIDEPIEIEWDIAIPDSGEFQVNTSVDDEAELFINNQHIKKLDFSESTKSFSLNLEKGFHTLKSVVKNRSWGGNTWQDNPGGIAILINDKKGNTIFSTREYSVGAKASGIVTTKSEVKKSADITINDSHNTQNPNSSNTALDQFMNYLTRTDWIVTEYAPSFAKSYYGAKCKFTKNSFSYVPRYKGVFLDEIKYKIDIIGIQENFPEGSKYSGAFNFHNLQQRNDIQQHAFVYLKEDVVLWKSGFQGYTINLVLTRAK